MITVAEMLAHKPRPFNFIEPDARVQDALNLLSAVNLSYLIVMHDQDFRGIFCERDFLRNVAMRGWDPNACMVCDTMTGPLPLVSPGDAADTCVELMNLHQVRYLPVFDNHRFVGVITPEDIMRSLSNRREDWFEPAVKRGDAQEFHMRY